MPLNSSIQHDHWQPPHLAVCGPGGLHSAGVLTTAFVLQSGYSQRDFRQRLHERALVAYTYLEKDELRSSAFQEFQKRFQHTLTEEIIQLYDAKGKGPRSESRQTVLGKDNFIYGPLNKAGRHVQRVATATEARRKTRLKTSWPGTAYQPQERRFQRFSILVLCLISVLVSCWLYH